MQRRHVLELGEQRCPAPDDGSGSLLVFHPDMRSSISGPKSTDDSAVCLVVCVRGKLLYHCRISDFDVETSPSTAIPNIAVSLPSSWGRLLHGFHGRLSGQPAATWH